MSVYTPPPGDASCAASGCSCRARIARYPSDLTDAQWSVLEREARGVMAELVVVTGRPMLHDLRAMLDGIGYVTRYSVEWRALPVDPLGQLGDWEMGQRPAEVPAGIAALQPSRQYGVERHS